MAIAIDTWLLFNELSDDECPSDPCTFTLTLQGDNTETVEDSITFYVWQPPTGCTLSAATIDDASTVGESLTTEF